jgi:hypothetical protein
VVGLLECEQDDDDNHQPDAHGSPEHQLVTQRLVFFHGVKHPACGEDGELVHAALTSLVTVNSQPHLSQVCLPLNS